MSALRRAKEFNMKSASSLKIELQYFVTIVCCSTLYKNTHIDYSLFESYRKASFRNRCLIAGANGVVVLSVPVKGGRGQKTLYRDVRVDDSMPWQRRHFQSILSAYGRAPFFEHYVEGLSRLFTRREGWLVDWNFACLDWVDGVLGFGAVRDRTFRVGQGEPVEDLTDRVRPGNYTSPELGPFPRYPQVFESKLGFLPNLSILDLLMSMGPESRGVLLPGPGK